MALIRIISSLLLTLAIISAGISPELFHEHEHEHVCHEPHQAEKIDSCHLHLFHSHGLEKCKDHNHLTPAEELCELCMISPIALNLQSVKERDGRCYSSSAERFADYIRVDVYKHPVASDRLRGPPVLA